MVGGLLSQAEEEILEDLDLILGSITVLLCDHGQDISSDSYSVFLILSVYFCFIWIMNSVRRKHLTLCSTMKKKLEEQ